MNIYEYYSLICIISIITIDSNVIDNITMYNHLIRIILLFTNYYYLYQLFYSIITIIIIIINNK